MDREVPGKTGQAEEGKSVFTSDLKESHGINLPKTTGWKESEGMRKEEGREWLAASCRVATNSDSCSMLVISNVFHIPFLITVKGTSLSGDFPHVTATLGAGSW